MMITTTTRRFLSLGIASITALLIAASRPADAQVAVDGGVFGVDGTASVGAALSLQIFKTPVLPLAVDVTAAAPLDGHGFAATADGRFRLGATTVGVGIGGGNLAQTNHYGVIYEGILAQQLIPHLAVEGRVYFGPSRPSAIFGGLRLSL
ncbi:MAG: hypothetical protein ACRENA_12590 [Vulcanimicrobiaceae bacterium]